MTESFLDQTGQTPLSYLFGAYFHLDFKIVTGSVAATTARYLVENPEMATSLAEEIATALNTKSEEGARNLAIEMGACYRADANGRTYREWFASIEAQARTFAAEHPQTAQGDQPQQPPEADR